MDEGRFLRLESDVDKLKRVVFEGDGDKPSLTAAMLVMGEKLDSLKDSIESVPGRIGMWVAILGGMIGLLVFLGPSIRHAIGMTQSDAHAPSLSEVQPQNAKIPAL